MLIAFAIDQMYYKLDDRNSHSNFKNVPDKLKNVNLLVMSTAIKHNKQLI